jgi:hypothetical protein
MWSKWSRSKWSNSILKHEIEFTIKIYIFIVAVIVYLKTDFDHFDLDHYDRVSQIFIFNEKS